MGTYMKKYRLIPIVLLTALLMAGGKAIAQGVQIGGSVYGGGNLAVVKTNTYVKIGNKSDAVSISGNVYGGGSLGDVGTYTTDEDGYNNWPVNTGTCTVSIIGGTIGPVGDNATADKDHGNVFGAGKGSGDNTFFCEKAMVSSTSVSITNGTVKGNVYGGGEIGRVEHNTVVAIGSGEGVAAGGTPTSAPDIKGSVFGAGKGLETHGYSALVRGNPQVTIEGNAQVGKNVYGGGEIATVGRYKVVDDLPTVQLRGGECTVIVRGHAIIGSNGASAHAGHVFGAGKGVEPDYHADGTNKSQKMTGSGQLADFTGLEDYLSFLTTLALATHTSVTINGNATVNGSVYGGSENGFVQHNTSVTIQNGEIGTTNSYGNIYGGGLGYSGFAEAGRVGGNTVVNVKGGAAHGSVYGGGQMGIVKCNVNVNILGGTVDKDVYGGGALANTNTDGYELLSGITAGTTVVTGLYTYDKTLNQYTEITEANQTATANTDYYRKVTGTMVNLLGGTIGGDAYGGGEGSASVAASEGDTKVNLNGMSIDEYTSDFSSSVQEADVDGVTGTDYYMVNPETQGCVVNRIFGANNINGTPLGNVTVHVYGTQHIDKSSINAKYAIPAEQGENETPKAYLQRLINATIISESENVKTYITGITESEITDAQAVYNNAEATETQINTAIANVTEQLQKRYDVAAVYGGGNEAAYNPTTPYTETATDGSKSQVIIDGCDYTSIEYVYGGGNAAAVPETNVTVNAAYEIYNVFGGGNGKDRLSSGAENPGADVGVLNNQTYGTGKATTRLIGGTIHEAYGASNTKGNVKTVDIDTGTGGYCTLDLGKMVGAGKNADIDGDVNLVLGCKPGAKIPEIYGGADNANVNGSIRLTITSGNYGKVFGGNNLGGIIKGSITLNIEETGDCDTPINIDELYLGGNQAAYSVYGYKDVSGTLVPRSSLSDGTLAYAEPASHPTGQLYSDPVLNVISCTSIGKVFGGGLGANAIIYGNPTVNINMIPGSKAALIDRDKNGTPDDPTGNLLGTIGDVFGGGNEAKVEGNTKINIGTETTVEMNTAPTYLGAEGTAYQYNSTTKKYYNITVSGANITGNVYGGGNLADVTGNTQVNICAKEVTNNNTTTWQSVPFTASQVTIGVAGVNDDDHGNVYGGGKGVAAETGARAFFCEEAMVGEDNKNSEDNNDDPAYANDGTHVRIGNGTVNGSVYGGGEIGRVEFHTEVVIGLGDGTGGTTKSPVINGSVFGAGKGTNTHGYSGLVRGDSKVTVQADAKIGQSVYGGGEMASIGKYELDANGLPKTPKFGGKCTVTIQGYAEIGPDNMQMTKAGGPDDTGHVFGAGKGTLPYENVTGTPWSMELTGKVNYDEGKESDYYKFIQSLGLASNTEVTIGEHAFVKGSVYGGSENGYLQADAHVTIAGGQIGEGLGQTAPYADAAFIDPSNPETPVTTSNALATCATWTYDKETTGKPYDKYATYLNSTDNEYYYDAGHTKSSAGGAPVATDGHTYYGNVFGGGRGVVPFAAGKWHRAAGSVAGNTRVDITGGHILSSVYGGNENTDVGSYAMGTNGEPTTTLNSGGTCTINMSGGTVGVPRTKEQIDNNPVIGNVFGAGKGDKRVLFNTWTNVGATSVNISGTARIYGSVFGGGEDGHVIGNAVTNIGGTVTIGETQHTHSNVVIGSTGISGADGNVFGGGRGSVTALTAGVVGGNVTLTIDNGKILGSAYGGGRLASVGTNFVNPENTSLYGALQTPDADHGNITVYINDGTIGQSNSTGVNGNIFGGSKGTESDFRLGIVRSTTINMTGGTAYASVYGGGELAQVVESHTTGSKVLGTEINISGGTIGISGKGEAIWGNVFGGGKGNDTHLDAGLVKKNTSVKISETDATNKPTIIYHNIYGGGAYSSVGTITRDDNVDYVIGQASVTDMPTAWAVNTGLAEVTILGGTIGVDGKDNGMIFGSSRGDVGAPGAIHDKLAWVKDTKVVIGASGTDGPNIKGSVYGSGENGHTFHDTDVKVHSGTIGIASGADVVVTNKDNSTTTYAAYNYPYRGNVYGGGCGTDTYNVVENEKTYKKYNPLAGIVLGDANVTVDGGHVVHNVYGAGAMGSVGTIDNDEIVTHNSYTDDGKESYYNFGLSWPVKFVYKTDADSELTGKTTVKIEGTAIIGVTNSDAKGGHIFGAARGGVDVGQTGIADQRYEEAKLANVRRTEVFIGTSSGESTTTTPTIRGSVYGGGEDGHVYEDANIAIYHGTIAHSVFGGGKGESTYKTKLWSAANTEKDAAEAVHSWTAGKVYGNTHVTMNGGSVGYNIYGGGNLASVGKGNYSGGSDDYSADGYGEHPEDGNAGLWTNTANTDSYLFLNSGIAYVNIYGGNVGADSANDTEDGTATGFPRGNVFGSSRGVAAPSGSQSPRYRYKPDFFLGYVNKTIVTIGDDTHTAPKIYGSVYGGGQDGHVRNSTLVTIHKGEIGRNGDTNIERGNVFGAGSGTGKYDSNGDGNADACNYSSGSVSCTTQIDIEGSTTDTKIYGNVYGGGALASVGPPFTGVQVINSTAYDEVKKVKSGNSKASVSYSQVNIKGGTVTGSVYGASRGPSDALMTEVFDESDEDHTYTPKKYATVIWADVNVTGAANITGSVYGGGEKGIVKHATEVNIGTTGTGGVAYTGTISEDVFGGGKEAIVGGNVTVNMNSGTVNKGVYGGGALAHTNTNNATLNTGDNKPDTGAKVTGDATTIAITGETNNPETKVNLLGGLIKGDAYGGGLGRLEVKSGETVTTAGIPAMVYGNVSVTLGDNPVNPTTATAFNISTLTDNSDTSKPVEVVNSGRVFGCNNLNGSPKGNVTVTVNKTVAGNKTRTASAALYKKVGDEGYVPHTYEVAAVYGGGNLADYVATGSGKKSNVIINSCDVSIEDVYGGGNAAAVPETDVLVMGAYEIENVFGGGNGEDNYTLDGGTTWKTNPGANVNGNATTLLRGGYIHAGYGGSNSRGTISGNVSIDKGIGGRCTLNVTEIYGAGKDADVEGDLILIMGCSETRTEAVYGCSMNANVKGNVELTITSGEYGKVFGGNNQSGAIFGHIIVNVEETGCSPIIIDELYGCGNDAAYSTYGYYQDGTLANGKPKYMPRTSATDTHPYVYFGNNDETDHTKPPYADPEVNIISCTRIGKVFGGGLGSNAIVYGNPKVNINMIKGVWANRTYKAGTSDERAVPDELGKVGDGYIDATTSETVEGGVFGGGNEAKVEGNTTVNIGTATSVSVFKLDANDKPIPTSETDDTPQTESKTVAGANITQNVYGGGNQADVTGNTYVNVCAVKDDDNTTTDVIEYKGVTISGENIEGVTIKGNVFGGGKGITEDAGVTGAFECAKAMVGVVNANNGSIDITKESIDKGTRVSIGNGTIEGSVYGGGEVGRVEWNGVVTIGLPVGTGETSAPEIKRDVFGGGKGVEQYGYAALMRGNTFVTVQANAKVGKSVYGGGEIASVGKYNIVQPDDINNSTFMAAHPGIEVGMPYSLANQGSGYCNVIVRGNAEIGPDNMKMYHDDGKAPEDEGHVFGAGKGILPYENEDDFNCQASGHAGQKHPGRMSKGDAWECYNNNETGYLRFIETQALATHTEVFVGGDAFVKGSVYGGSLSGHVQHDTHVTITGDCQIGAGDGINERYTTHYNVTKWPTDIQTLETSWAECAHWTMDVNNIMPYDPYAKHYNSEDGKYYYDTDFTDPNNNSYGGSSVATDGHTYYGNVFGGGSGVVPYKPGKWHREAGTVGGNTVVDITGGHILTSVYGGNECTDVGTYDPSNRALLAGTGKCIINMTGGTVGVPRTKEDIAAHPMTCCVYGGGKGDQRVSFNKWTNVGETEVNITKEARIYGSVFGGGEDGHVLGNAVTNIGGSVTIGSTTYTHPTTTSNTDPGVIIGSQGRSGADGNVFGGGRGFSEVALTAGVVCGNVTLNIHDGKVLGSVYGGGRLASVGTHLAGSEHANYGTLIPNGKNQVIGSTDETAEGATHGIINIIIAGGTIGATDSDGKLLTSSSSIGDVFGGCRGAGSDKRFGLAKKTTVTMTAGTVKGNVYGGGELGYVGEATLNSSNVYEWNEEAAGGGLCTVGISGGTVAGNVFGAGKGLADDFDCEKALVRTTNVTISGTGTSVGGNVYGGGEVGRVDQDTEVTIGNGDGTNGGAAAPTITGNVFGAGAGVETHGYSALVRGNATVTVQGNASVGHNVYGGGMIASVGQYGLDSNFMPETLKGGGDCRVTVKGYSVIGASGEGHVFGAGMGINPFDAAHNYINYTNDSENPNNKKTKPKRMTKRPAADKMPALWDPVGDGSEYIWEYYTSQDNYFKFLQTLALATDSYATIDGNATVKGNVYGGGESGFVQRETDVKIQGSGKILTVTDTNTNTTTDGNVFGGGRGVSGFDLAGRVRGNAKTTISGSSTVNGNVYGGGELGFVGKFAVSANGRNYDWQKIKNQQDKEEETGTCTVIINSATAEVKGDVFGAGKGEAITFKCEPAMTRTTSVSVNAGTVDGNVYGGGEVGRVDENTVVTIGAATGESAPDIKGSVFGAGAGLGTHGYSALVRGNTYVTVQNHAAVGHSVYGGGEIASVGKYGLDDQKMPSVLLGGGYCYVKVKGDATISGDVFGAGQGITPNFDKDNADRAKRPRRMTMYTNNTDFPSTAMLPANTGEASGTTTQGTTWEYYETGSPYIWEYFREESGYLTYLETLALATHPEVTIEGNASIGNDVYGGGERGIAKGSVIVNINGGTITRDVYGGGALANTNTTSTVGNEDYNTGVITTTTVAPTTTVNLHGGIIGRNVFGGGLGQKYKAAVAAQPAVEGHGEVGDEDYVAAQPAIAAQPEMPAIAALVYGDVLVKLNETPTVTNNVASFPDNCVVKGVIHGANNYNGSPQGDVTVHIYKTMARDEINKKSQDKDGSSYDLKAVYGGGNEAAYDPIEPNTRKAHVIIEGCGDTSIETVYGGGNAAAAPATHVEVNSCYEIGTVFAGGNGKDAMEDGSENPGADVGLIALKTGGTPYENDHSKQAYGTGIALAEIHGGFVHSAFGGSNTKGNVRESATVDLSEPDVVTCPLGIDEAYGAGNEAAQDGTSNINLGCLSYLREIYGGAKNADVNNDIVLNIQSGRFHRVFGGNNIGGKIDGSITVNIEETGCHPIVIGQLFGGGNQAGYSVYGYKDVNGKWVPRESATDSGEGPEKPYRDPLVNVRSFTSIGEIYGGGFGNSAVIVGNPTVDINVCDGNSAAVDITGDWKDQNGNVVDENVKVSANTSQWIRIKVAEGEYNTVWQPEHKSGAIGTIGNVFGGGNAAPVHGNTNVYIGTKNQVVFETPKKKPDTTNGGEMNTTVEDRTHIVKGANITGNVYGGGNAADVSGDTNVVIGKEKN